MPLEGLQALCEWPLLSASDTPDPTADPRQGYNYQTSPNEKRASARARGSQRPLVRDHLRLRRRHREKRGGQLAKVFSHFYQGVSRESFGGKTAGQARRASSSSSRVRARRRGGDGCRACLRHHPGRQAGWPAVWAYASSARVSRSTKDAVQIASNTKTLTTLMLPSLSMARRCVGQQVRRSCELQAATPRSPTGARQAPDLRVHRPPRQDLGVDHGVEGLPPTRWLKTSAR